MYTINPPFYILTFNYIADKILFELEKTNKQLLFLIWFPILDKDGALYVKKNCKNYTLRPIKMVLNKNKTEKIQEIKNSVYNITTKILCNDDISYYDYNNNTSAFITYTYLFVLGKNVNSNKILSIINNQKYIHK